MGASSAAILAGCFGGGKDISKDPNPYDYTFVEGDDLARNLPSYEEDDIKTETTVSFDGFLKSMDHDRLRVYTATPDDTMHTFPVAEFLNGPIQEIFGETLDEPAHEDTELELYGFVDYVSNDGYDVSSSYNNYVFLAEDATRVQSQGETSDG